METLIFIFAVTAFVLSIDSHMKIKRLEKQIADIEDGKHEETGDGLHE